MVEGTALPSSLSLSPRRQSSTVDNAYVNSQLILNAAPPSHIRNGSEVSHENPSPMAMHVTGLSSNAAHRATRRAHGLVQVPAAE